VSDFTYGELRVMAWLNPAAFLSIGRFVSISPGVVFILEGNHAIDSISTYPIAVEADRWVLDRANPEHQAISKGPVTVADDVWIGTNAIIMSGVTVGQGAIIAAASVVTRDVEPYSIAGGNPAKVIRKRFSDPMISRLLASADYSKLSLAKLQQFRRTLLMPLTEENLAEILAVFDQ
jgi:virginiamycin A acetyltransferase